MNSRAITLSPTSVTSSEESTPPGESADALEDIKHIGKAQPDVTTLLECVSLQEYGGCLVDQVHREMAIKEVSQRQITEQQFIQIAELQKENQRLKQEFDAEAAALKEAHYALVGQLQEELKAARELVSGDQAAQIAVLQAANVELDTALQKSTERLAELDKQKTVRSASSRRTTPLPPASGPPPSSPLPPTPQTASGSAPSSRAPSLLEIPGPLGSCGRRGSEESITSRNEPYTGQSDSTGRRGDTNASATLRNAPSESSPPSALKNGVSSPVERGGRDLQRNGHSSQLATVASLEAELTDYRKTSTSTGPS